MCDPQFIIYETFNNYYRLLKQTMHTSVSQIKVVNFQNCKSKNFQGHLTGLFLSVNISVFAT